MLDRGTTFACGSVERMEGDDYLHGFICSDRGFCYCKKVKSIQLNDEVRKRRQMTLIHEN